MPFMLSPLKYPKISASFFLNFPKAGRFQPAMYSVRRESCWQQMVSITCRYQSWAGFRQQMAGRFLKSLILLQEVAVKDLPHLEEAVSSFLDDSPRLGQPSHYTDKQIINSLRLSAVIQKN